MNPVNPTVVWPEATDVTAAPSAPGRARPRTVKSGIPYSGAQVADLVKRYPKSPVNAVDGLSFTVTQGEVFGLLGPNGAGKTTTVGVLTTRVRPTSGRASVCGVDVARHPILARSKFAVVPQRINLDRSLSIRNSLVFHAAYHGVPSGQRAARADDLLAQFGLLERAKSKHEGHQAGLPEWQGPQRPLRLIRPPLVLRRIDDHDGVHEVGQRQLHLGWHSGELLARQVLQLPSEQAQTPS